MLHTSLRYLVASLAGLCASIAAAQSPGTWAVRLPAPPTLDGDIAGDPAWTDVPIATGFTQTRPNEGQPASQRTEVGIAYTDDALYIGVICHDSNPEQIIVADSRRDSPLRETDSFLVVLDSFLDRQNGLVFGTNPAGLEYDAQLIGEGRRGFNVNWDTNWRVRTQINEQSWSAEFEIPFSSLRYGAAEVQTWGVNFQRNIRRNNEETYWAPLPRQFGLSRVSLAGTVENLEVPHRRSLKFIPYALVGAQRGGDLPPGTTDTREAGFDLKYAITPSLVLDATYNTDFAQVEVDDIQVNLNRFSLFFPEKRPFFLENADQFAVGQSREIELFFSRRIGVGDGGARLPITGGARLSGKIGERTNVGFLQMRSEAVDGLAPQNDYTVARVNRELADRTSIGAIFVNRAGENSGDYNRSYGIDGRLGIGQAIVISGFAARTESPDQRGRDHAYRIEINHDDEDWSNSMAYTEVGDAFNPEVGFLRRRAYRRGQLRLFRRIRPKNWLGIQELRPHISYSGYWDLDGFQETGFLHIDNHWEWKTGHEIHTGVNFTFEGVKQPFDLVDGVTIPAGEYDNSELQLIGWNNRGAAVNLEVRSFIGGFFNGDRVTVEPTLNLRSSEKFRASLSWNYNDISLPVDNGDVKINLGRLRMSYSFTPRLTVQALVQYDDRSDTLGTNLRLAWQQSANAGLFLVLNEVDEGNALRPAQREIILKYSRIFDVLR